MPEPPFDGNIVITPKEFYDGVRQDIGDIKNSVNEVAMALAPLPKRVDKLEASIEVLREKQSATDRKIIWLAGFAAGAGGTLGSIVSTYLS